MKEKSFKKNTGISKRYYPTILHESSADNAQNIDMSGLQPIRNVDHPAHKRMHNGSDGSTKAGRGSNH